jgi:hypothetical protein
MGQLLCHLWGDYILQSDWMAQHKTKSDLAALVHAVLYSLAFLVLDPSTLGLAIIFVTHFFIDRFRLARFVVWAKNWMGPNLPFSECSATGYPSDRPAFMAVWLLIIADNVLHLTINFVALRLR